MNTILIPIDFTRASNNAVSYAVDMTRDYAITHIILVVSDYVSEFEAIIPTADFIQFSIDKIQATDEVLEAQFNQLKTTLLKNLKPSVRVSFILGKDPLLLSLAHLVKQERPDLIILASDESDNNEDSFMADHLIEIAQASTIPVLIIPSKCSYQIIEMVLIPFNASNFSNIKLLKYLGQSIVLSSPKLQLLNVEYTKKTNDAHKISDQDLVELEHLLIEYQQEIFFAEYEDILQSIKHFILQKNPQLLVALPGKHGILYKLSHRNVIKALAQNNLKPVLILKDL